MPDKETTSFMRSLCMGLIEQDVLFPFPALSEDEKATMHEITGAVDDLLGPRAEDFRQWDVAGEMPPDFIEELSQFGLFGLIIPEAHGGMGLGNMAYSRTLQEVGKHDASVAEIVGTVRAGKIRRLSTDGACGGGVGHGRGNCHAHGPGQHRTASHPRQRRGV